MKRTFLKQSNCSFEIASNAPLRIILRGSWNYQSRALELDALFKLIRENEVIELDFSENPRVDFSFCALLLEILENKHYVFLHPNTQIKVIFEVLQKQVKSESNVEIKQKKLGIPFAKSIKDFCMDFKETCEGFLTFLGMSVYYTMLSILHPSRFKISSIFYHIREAGLKALPVVLATSFIVSYAIAMQGAIMLNKMNASLMSVEVMSKLSLRELGPFILALVVSARSASAFSAQIGMMNLNEENDALKSMGLSIMDYLVIPRIISLALMMPLLVFLSDMVSLIASCLAIKAVANISYSLFWERFYEYVGLSHFLIGIIKAPFFGLAIALTGCFRGLKIKKDSESIGLQTTRSVVNAMFWIIVINAIFSFITTRLNV